MALDDAPTEADLDELREPGGARLDFKRAAVLLGLLLVVVFLPFAIGSKTLLSSARDVPSIYPYGAAGDSPGANVLKAPDAGAAGWQTEPYFAIEERELLREHVLPVWNPYSGLGSPLAANLQSQPYYPLSFLYALVPSPLTYNWWVILRLFVAGLGMYAFLRWHVLFFPALLGAVATMLTGYYVFHYDMPHLSVDVLLPALLFCVEFALRKPGPASFALTFVVAFSAVAGGMPESTLLVYSFTVLYALFALFAARRDGRRIRTGALTLTAGVALGIAASAIALIPFAEFLHVSFNSHDPSRGPRTFPGPLAETFRITIAQYIAPLMVGPTRNNIFEGFSSPSGLRGYFGVAVAFFALIAVIDAGFRRFKGKLTRTDAVLAFFGCAVALLLAKRFGFPLVNWIGYLPGFRYVIFALFQESLLAVSIAACAAIGLERLLSGRIPSWCTIASAAVWLAAISAIETVFAPRLAAAAHPEYFEWAMTTALVTLAAAFLVVVASSSARAWLRPAVLGPAAVVIVALELTGSYIVPLFYVFNPEPALATNPYRGAPFVSYLQSVAPPSRWRVLGKDGYLYPSWSGAFGLADVTQLDALLYERYLPWIYAFLNPPDAPDPDLYDRYTGVSRNTYGTAVERRLLQLSSVRYVVAATLVTTPVAASGAAPASMFRRLDVSDAPVYELSPVLSRATLFYGVELQPSGESALRAVASPRFDIFSRAVVEAQPQTTDDELRRLSASAPAAAQPATVTRYDSTRVVVDARPARSALLMLNDIDYPGWSATVDGTPAPILAADYLFRGVVLRPGAHEVVFRYDPPSLRIGEAISLAAIVVAACATFWMARRRRVAAAAD